MNSSKFLEQVADYFTCLHPEYDLHKIIFILPNKRSAMFLKHYVQQRVTGNAVFMPHFTTFARYMARNSAIAEAGRFDSLFLLYKSYCSVMGKHNPQEQVKDFDKFVFWGDMILNDFDEIDKSLADAQKLYRNLSELKQITSDYLTEAQKTIIRELWGDTAVTTSSSGDFWFHVKKRSHNGDDKPSLSSKFISLWEILGEVYEDFQAKLCELNIATAGMQARKAFENLQKTDIDRLQRNVYVFVGHSDLSVAECAIMDRLKDVGQALFFWDFEPPFFTKSTENNKFDIENRAFGIIRNLLKRYPMPGDFQLVNSAEFPKIDIIGVPSAVGQAKEADAIIANLQEQGQLSDDNAIKTAIVLPDESMLMPLMLGLPTQLSSFNVTMSLPYASTKFATLFRAIISMQRNARKRKDKWTFFYKDVLEVLLHPHITMIAPSDSKRVREYILKTGVFNITAEDLLKECKELDFVFRAVEDCQKLDDVYQYTKNLIDGMHRAVEKYSRHDAMELNLLEKFGQDVEEIKELAEKYQIEMQESTFFILFERMMSTSKIPLTGTPLKGMQVMGVLESRALDFDNLIFLSMSERTFPRKNYVRTMIPNNLRRGYGLAPIELQESFYAYYFYCALTRAKHATLIYDSRTNGVGGGEMSRYLTQLLYIYDNENITHSHVELNGSQPSPRVIEVVKTDEVMKELEAFTQKDGLTLSASALKTYMTCPLSFYLQYVKRLREPDEPSESLTAAQVGNVLHNSMQELYDEHKAEAFDNAVYEQIADKVEDIVYKQMSKERHKGKIIPREDFLGESLLMSEMISQQIRFILFVEQKSGQSFSYKYGEYPVEKPWQIAGHTINFKMKIDRIDTLSNGHLRFIDYKTGSDEYTAPSIAHLFSAEHKYHAIFQLLLYAEAYNDLEDSSSNIDISLYVVKDIMKNGVINPIKVDKQVIDRANVRQQFRVLLESLIQSIFDRNTPFTQCKELEGCKFCQFRLMCGKTIPEQKY